MGDMCVVWKQEEEGETELGVTDILAFAVLLRTDGLPFSLSVQLTAPILGNLYRAQTKLRFEVSTCGCRREGMCGNRSGAT